jgi:glycosyltransferase involved in cell wall biosynthesis
MEVADQPYTKKKRILFVITKANWGGAQRNVHDLAIAAHEAQYQVLVACGTQGELASRLQDKGIEVQFVPGLARDISLTGDPRAFLFLYHLCRIYSPDIIHAHSSKAGLLATLAARIAGVRKIIFTAHGWAFNETRPLWQKAVFAIFHVVTVYAAHTVICVSKAVERDIVWVPCPRKKFIVIHNGISDIELKSKSAARNILAPSTTESIWIGTLAELHPTKGLDIALRAFAPIAHELPEVALVLIGEGQERARLTSLAEELSIAHRVYFCGHVSLASSLLGALDIFLFPSRSEALGYVALEAGRASVPVIASRVGGIPEIIENNVSGILVPVGSVDGFTKGLRKLLDDPELRNTLGKNLCEKVRREFSQAQMVHNTLALYSDH